MPFRVHVLTRTLVGLLLALATLTSAMSPDGATPAYAEPAGISVAGNQLVASDGSPVHLTGVNRSGTEFACVRGWGIFDGPSDSASIQAMRAWHLNVVRLGLNEDCWLGINGVRPDFGGANYQKAVVAYARGLEQSGMYVILDLHWSAAGTAPATALQPMPDADHANTFWQSVAATFSDDPNVIFDVFNEPFGVDWPCWRDGCMYPGDPPGADWHASGMQSLVDTIRATGANQPIMLGGLAFANDVRDWDPYKPHDPLNQLIASVHVYPVNRCNVADCWDNEIAPIAASVPVVISEFGTTWDPPFGDTMALDLMDWADRLQIGYLAWTWNAWSSPDTLITNFSGDPTAWGTDFRSHLLQNAIPRLQPLVNANAAYARGDLPTAVNLYKQVADAAPSDQETQDVAVAISGLARFRALVALISLGDEEDAHRDLQALVDADANAPLARLASQFWDQYSMTASAQAACAQMTGAVDSVGQDVLNTLSSVGIKIQHDELCPVPSRAPSSPAAVIRAQAI